ncbi:MAG: AAA family ATPase, partial [Acidimicrobiales bacterium]|nr:AAA family ATPase [Acidimicrobiales bacterium]
KETKSVIYACHRRAISYVLKYAEQEVFHSRSGTNGIVQEDIKGVVATAFTHWDSRAGDPQLHDHVVIWNRAQAHSDGKWRTLDSRGLFKAVVTLSEMHQGVLFDELTQALGVGWDERTRRHSEKPRWEIMEVPEKLMEQFSKRAEQVDIKRGELINSFVDSHGRQPTDVEAIRIRQQATLETRGKKSHRSLHEMTKLWRDEAAKFISDDQSAWVTSLRDRNDLPLLKSIDLSQEIISDASVVVVTRVAERHATYSIDNLKAESHRLLHGVRFMTPDERIACSDRIVEGAINNSIALSPPTLHHTPERFIRSDGSSRLRPKNHVKYTTQLLLDAETRLLEAGRNNNSPKVSVAKVVEVVNNNLEGRDYKLSDDQSLAVEKIATSGRVLDVLVGPAGTGKSTTMAGLRSLWESEYGEGSVIGLAPSSAAAEVLATELGIDTENTAKWLSGYRRIPELSLKHKKLATSLSRHPHKASPQAWKLRQKLTEIEQDIASKKLKSGQLVIVDEASLAGTFALDELASAVKDVGAKLLLVGDWAQLSSVEAGGAFSLLVKDRGDLVPELTDIRRFESRWEKTASAQLRTGDISSIEAYDNHGKITEGTREELLDSIYKAWKSDRDSGKTSLMIAGDSLTVRELNQRARAELVEAGIVSKEGAKLGSGYIVGVGDEIVTRQNNRFLSAGKSYVKNGDRWKVTSINNDGSMAVHRNGIEVVLPKDYVEEFVELDYASTAHRAQGRTVDTSHSLVSPTTTREVLYVAATRGKESNSIYVDTNYDPDPDTSHDEVAAKQSCRDVLIQVLKNEGRDVSATETIASFREEQGSLKTMLSEYLTLASFAQAQRFEEVFDSLGLKSDQLVEIQESESYGALLAALREAEAYGFNLEKDLQRLASARPTDEAEDLAALLHGRVDRWIVNIGCSRNQNQNLIVGLVPKVLNVIDPDMQMALLERENAIEMRAIQLAEKAMNDNARWIAGLGPLPSDQSRKKVWLATVSMIAAYRDYWDIGDHPSPLGSEDRAATLSQASHRAQAKKSFGQLSAATCNGPPSQALHPSLHQVDNQEICRSF